jgi:hypothetical protein
MKWFGPALMCLFLAACATLSAERRAALAQTELWREAHEALAMQQFARADTLFGTIVREYASTSAGRESLFYIAAMRLDPRNPDWSSALAESALEVYLSADTAARMELRRPESRTLYELARQLNMPAENRVPGLQVEPRVVTREVAVPQRIVPVAQVTALTAEVNRLREQLAARDAEIKRQAEELDRIRKTLTSPGTRD